MWHEFLKSETLHLLDTTMTTWPWRNHREFPHVKVFYLIYTEVASQYVTPRLDDTRSNDHNSYKSRASTFTVSYRTSLHPTAARGLPLCYATLASTMSRYAVCCYDIPVCFLHPAIHGTRRASLQYSNYIVIRKGPRGYDASRLASPALGRNVGYS